MLYLFLHDHIPREKCHQNTQGISWVPEAHSLYPGYFRGIISEPILEDWDHRFTSFFLQICRSKQGRVHRTSRSLIPLLASINTWLKAGYWARMRQIKVFKAVSPRASFARAAKPLVFPGLRLINSIILSRGISVHDTSYCYPRHAYLIMDHSHPLSSTQSIHL